MTKPCSQDRGIQSPLAAKILPDLSTLKEHCFLVLVLFSWGLKRGGRGNICITVCQHVKCSWNSNVTIFAEGVNTNYYTWMTFSWEGIKFLGTPKVTEGSTWFQTCPWQLLPSLGFQFTLHWFQGDCNGEFWMHRELNICWIQVKYIMFIQGTFGINTCLFIFMHCFDYNNLLSLSIPWISNETSRSNLFIP